MGPYEQEMEGVLRIRNGMGPYEYEMEGVPRKEIEWVLRTVDF
jgi:hypothetical protein